MNLKLTFIETLTLKQKQTLGVTAAVTLIVLLGLYFGVIQIQKSKRNASLKKIEEVKADLASAEKQKRDTPALEQQLNEMHKKLDSITVKFVPESEPNPWVTREIGKLLNTYNLENWNIASVSMQSSSFFPDFPFKEALIKVNCKAYFHNLGRFLQKFENEYPYFRVQNLDINPILGGINQEDQEKLTVKLEIVALIAPNPTKP